MHSKMVRPFLFIGGGGHARVLIAMLLAQGERVLGYTEREPELRRPIWSVPCFGEDDVILDYSPEEVCLVNAVGSTGDGGIRRAIFERYASRGYLFPPVISKQAHLSKRVFLSHGVQIMAGATIQCGVFLGENSIVNSGAIIDHDCRIGSHVHIAPGAVLSGGVRMGEGAHVGTGASVIQGVAIGANALVAAGAVVVSEVKENSRVFGVPASIRE